MTGAGSSQRLYICSVEDYILKKLLVKFKRCFRYQRTEVIGIMANKNNSALFYTCSCIEYIGRKMKQKRRDVVKKLGKEAVERIYEYSDVFHCEPIEKVAEEFIEQYGIEKGSFDNEQMCQYTVPDYWTIGEVYERLIEDVAEEDMIIQKLIEVYLSWIDDFLSNYNIAVYYQSRDYIAECYREGAIL